MALDLDMSRRYLCRLTAGLAIGLAAIHNAVAQPYLGLGVSHFSLSSEYSPIDGRSGTGFALLGGIQFAGTWFTELSVSATDIDTGPTQGIFYPADSAEYSILRLSIGKSFWTFRERRWRPWVALGGAYHYVNWDTFYYQLDGTGLSLGAGVDFELVQAWQVRLQAVWHRFSARDTYDEGPFSTRTRELSAAVIYAFR